MKIVIGKVYTCKYKIFEKRTNLCNIMFSQTAQSLIIATLRSKVYQVTIYFNNILNTTCSIDNSKRNETTTGGTQYHDDRPEVDMFGNKDNRDVNVNTEATGYSKR